MRGNLTLRALHRAILSALQPTPFSTTLQTPSSMCQTLSRYSTLHTTTTVASQTPKIAVALSGGVDSAVAAFLLKQAGHDIVGIFMRNWDEAEEKGNKNCSIEEDYRDAKAVCRRLSIPLHDANFVSQYWNDVFSGFLQECSRGLTPNPDVSCNRFIKFGALIEYAKALGIETVATGHYARLLKRTSKGDDDDDINGNGIQLLRGVDDHKDQSYFLSSVHKDAFKNIIFPLGSYLKTQVRSIAEENSLVPSHKRSSAGICFIGRRNFSNFLSEYLTPIPGEYIDIETGNVIGICPDILVVTFGQRPGIGGASERTYVVGKDMRNQKVFVTLGQEHPALLTQSACLRTPHWLSHHHERVLMQGGEVQCQYKARYGQPLKECTLRMVRGDVDADEVALSFTSSRFCVLHPQDSEILPGYLIVEFDEPALSITPQQMFVMYDGDVCLGSAPVAVPGETVYELLMQMNL